MRSVLLLALLTTAPLATAQQTDAGWLSPEGHQALAAHRFLFDSFAPAHTPEFSGQPTDPGGRVLRRLTLVDTARELSGDAGIPLPAGTEKVAHLCRYIEIRGSGLDALSDIRLLPAAPESKLPVSAHTPTLYRVKVPALPVPGENSPQLHLAVSGTATVERIDLVPFAGGLPEEFDRAPFANLGHDRPPLDATVEVDTTTELSIGGHVDLDRTRWFRYYGKPTTLPPALERFALERNFLPGRQMIKFAPAFEVGYSKNAPKLKQDPQRPGYVDPAFFDQLYQGTTFRDLEKLYPPGFEFAVCMNDWPSFQSTGHSGRGTPAVEHFDAAADLVARFLRNQVQHSGRTATWWEVKNEASIKAEWDHHWTRDENGQPVDSWGLLADFHNRVADAAHAAAPGVKVGGPASAWMQLQVKEFGLWKSQAKFMDLTRGHLDFYSHHFYEDAGTLGAHARRDRGYKNYLLGRLPALIDMFRAHMRATDNVRPILVTEYGALNIGSSDADYWLRLRTYSAYLTQFMDHPDAVDLAVPFVFLASPWDPTNAHAMFVPLEGRRYPDDLDAYRQSHCVHFLDLWRDFAGRRLHTATRQPHLNTVAVHTGDTVHIALSNMGSRRLQIDLSTPLGDAAVGSATQRRLYRLNGEIIYTDAAPLGSTLRAIPVEVEETTIVTLKLKSAVEPSRTLLRNDHFAPVVAVPMPAGDPVTATITIPGEPGPATAALIVGLHRNGSFTKPITAAINGHTVTVDTTAERGVTETFTRFFIDVPADALAGENKIELSTPEDGATLTSLHLRTYRKTD